MSNVSANVIQSMFNHLSASYSETEAREILTQKYPESETVIKEIQPTAFRTTVVEMGKVKSVSDPATMEVGASLKKAVKAKVAKPKAETEKKVSKVDLARELYNQSENKTRAVVIVMFMDKLGMSKAMASTYFYSCKA